MEGYIKYRANKMLRMLGLERNLSRVHGQSNEMDPRVRR